MSRKVRIRIYIVAATIAFIPCIGVSQTFEQNAKQGCMETCTLEGNTEDCSIACDCIFDYLVFTFQDFSPLGLNVFTPIEHPDLYLEAGNDSARYCTAEYLPDYGIQHTRFMQVCLDSGTAASRNIRLGAWCGCVEDEIAQYGPTSSFLAELSNNASAASFDGAIKIFDKRYPGLADRVYSCAGGRPRSYDYSEEELTELDLLKSCADELNAVQDTCSWPAVNRAKQQIIEACRLRAEKFRHDGACQNVSDDQIRGFVNPRDHCLFYGADPFQFASILRTYGCPIADAPVQLQLRGPNIPWPAVKLASYEIPGLMFLSVRFQKVRDGTYYLFKGSYQDKEYEIMVQWRPSNSNRTRNPDINDMKVVSVKSPEIK